MTTRVLSALAYRAAMPLVDLTSLPRIVRDHRALIQEMSAAELHQYIRNATGLTRVEAEQVWQ